MTPKRLAAPKGGREEPSDFVGERARENESV
jgi:hypothetical protein